MIAYVSGTLVSKLEDSVVIDNQGIGYRVFCPSSPRLQQGQPCILYTYYYVREDAVLLYGFEKAEELDFFTKLITVKGLGPKTGMNILARIPYAELIRAIENADVAFLKTMPGVGPKMASQIVLDLKGKLVQGEVTKQDNVVLDDVFSALMDLGFKRSECNAIKNELLASGKSDLQTLVRLGLKLLAR